VPCPCDIAARPGRSLFLSRKAGHAPHRHERQPPERPDAGRGVGPRGGAGRRGGDDGLPGGAGARAHHVRRVGHAVHGEGGGPARPCHRRARHAEVAPASGGGDGAQRGGRAGGRCLWCRGGGGPARHARRRCGLRGGGRHRRRRDAGTGVPPRGSVLAGADLLPPVLVPLARCLRHGDRGGAQAVPPVLPAGGGGCGGRAAATRTAGGGHTSRAGPAPIRAARLPAGRLRRPAHECAAGHRQLGGAAGVDRREGLAARSSHRPGRCR